MALEAFAISFAKLVQIQENVDIQKDFDITVFVAGNSALADAKAEADALGFNSHTETLALTTTTVVQGVGSSSSSIAESVSAATKSWDFYW
jgi:formyltetrahydrofolate synthetase